MLALILGFFVKLAPGAFASVVKAHKDTLDAELGHDKLATDVVLKDYDAQVAARANATEIRKATAGFFEQRILSFLIAAPFVLHVLLVGADTNFKLGWQIWSFPKPFVDWEGAILLSYFGLVGATSGMASIASAIRGRK